ncbi:ribbon-helix-helix protein, CopG family [Methyloceanibacter methanicus]|uniref:ribbon-helix-helix protein, CopG family n=1 Tax=Methyloceanibacter methanicus TaxID=1774968 RepID=UPI0009F6A8FC
MAREFKGSRHCLGDDLAAELKTLCEERGMTASKVIRIAVKEFVAREKAKDAKAKSKS